MVEKSNLVKIILAKAEELMAATARLQATN